MNNDVQKEALTELAHKSELEQKLSIGYHGPPEIKAGEKAHYLGQFRERVIKVLTRRQIAGSKVYPEITEALRDKRAALLLIDGEISYKHRDKYQKLAGQMQKPFTIVHDCDLKGDVGLVVASDTAVDIEHITVE